MNCPKQKRGSFLVGVPGQGGAGRDGSGGGGGSGAGGGLGGVGRGVPSTDLLVGLGGNARRFLNCPKQKNGSFWLGSWTGWSRKGGGAGGGGSGAGEVGWTGRGVPSAELLLRGHSRWF